MNLDQCVAHILVLRIITATIDSSGLLFKHSWGRDYLPLPGWPINVGVGSWPLAPFVHFLYTFCAYTSLFVPSKPARAEDLIGMAAG